jgi:hypothetical protein
VGVVVAGTLVDDTFAANTESVRAFHEAILICAGLVAAGGFLAAVGISNPSRTEAGRCPGGQLVGAPEPAVESMTASARKIVEPLSQEA